MLLQRPGPIPLQIGTMCESFFASLECELLDRYTFKT